MHLYVRNSEERRKDMIKIETKHHCCGCQACVQVCPKSCLEMQQDEEGFLYPVLSAADACIQCGLCERVCPILHTPETEKKIPTAYAANNLNTSVRLESSSGGIFTLLAEQILSQGGIVYGAALDGGYVWHIRVEKAENLALLRGSKYVQSDIGKTYLQVKQDLEQKRKVLFTGTPCQIAGLKSFLRKDDDNLVCMDLICHGVPSPMVWKKYISFREKNAGASVVGMSFRDKQYGWKEFAMRVVFSDDAVYLRKTAEDVYMKAFLNDLCLRPSCYHCKFKKINRVSDITVADFWGIEDMCPDLDDDKGTSLVIVNSEKGRKIWEEIRSRTANLEVNFMQAIESNPAMVQSAKEPKDRSAFMREISESEFETVVLKYAKQSFSMKAFLKRMVKNTLRSLGLLHFVKQVKNRLKKNAY